MLHKEQSVLIALVIVPRCIDEPRTIASVTHNDFVDDIVNALAIRAPYGNQIHTVNDTFLNEFVQQCFICQWRDE